MRFRFFAHSQLKDWVGMEITADSGRHLFWGDLSLRDADEMLTSLNEALGSRAK